VRSLADEEGRPEGRGQRLERHKTALIVREKKRDNVVYWKTKRKIKSDFQFMT